ncbi:hypothetical protein K4F52_000968 [Lecanicillium sp. MT-2017a]|nr:hypothetical protein K4F52_000968 [Lecanicillium sp. MT-2017a]
MAADASSVLRCGLCNKPFDKHKTSAQRSSEASSDQSSALGQGSPGFFAAHNVNVNYNGSPGMYDADLSQGSAIQDLSVGYDTWDGIDWSNLLPSHMDIGTFHYNDPFPPTAMMNSDTAMIPSKLQIPMMPALNQPSIFHRQYTNVASQRVSQLILQTLKSYPLMMLRQKTPPPFIHPHLLIDTTTNDMEAWHNCMSLVHMMNGGIHGSRKLFWRNVRMECDRFCEQYLQLNKWELLAAMQALAVYAIVRLEEGDKDHYNVDALLLRAVTVISIRLMAVDTTSCSTPSDMLSQDTSWKNWIMEESRRRLCVLFQIVNMLVYFEPASMCEADGDVILAPLPAQKLLWEASDEHSWKLKGETEADAQREFGLAKNGLLVRMDEGAASERLGGWDVGAISSSTAKWNEWCSGMDGIGGLVMLAASLIQ